MRRVPGFITSNVQDSAPALIQPAELLLETIAEHLRASLGAKPGDLPVGEPTFTKDNVRGSLRVTLFRDGRMTMSVAADTLIGHPSSTAGIDRVAAILRTAWDEGDRVFWPEKAKGDSGAFHIHFSVPFPKKDGSAYPPEARFAVAVFSLAVPWVERATADDLPDPVYPDGPRSHNVQGRVMMSFVVDTTGYALISTLHDVLPPGAPIPVGDMAEYYREFVRAVAEALPRARFHAATLAGCRFPQPVTLPFDFKLSSVR